MEDKVEARCAVVRQTESHRGKQGLNYFEGISAQTAGSKALCPHVADIPPLGRAKPHLHENHESAVYVLSGEAGMWYGEAGMWYGEGLREHVRMRAGYFVYSRQRAAPAVQPQRAEEQLDEDDDRPLAVDPRASLEAGSLVAGACIAREPD